MFRVILQWPELIQDVGTLAGGRRAAGSISYGEEVNTIIISDIMPCVISVSRAAVIINSVFSYY